MIITLLNSKIYLIIVFLPLILAFLLYIYIWQCIDSYNCHINRFINIFYIETRINLISGADQIFFKHKKIFMLQETLDIAIKLNY